MCLQVNTGLGRDCCAATMSNEVTINGRPPAHQPGITSSCAINIYLRIGGGNLKVTLVVIPTCIQQQTFYLFTQPLQALTKVVPHTCRKKKVDVGGDVEVVALDFHDDEDDQASHAQSLKGKRVSGKPVSPTASAGHRVQYKYEYKYKQIQTQIRI